MMEVSRNNYREGEAATMDDLLKYHGSTSQRTAHTLCWKILNGTIMGVMWIYSLQKGVWKKPSHRPMKTSLSGMSSISPERRTHITSHHNRTQFGENFDLSIECHNNGAISCSFAFSLENGFIMLLLCPSQLRAQLGTTPNIKHIVVGRCYSYMTLVNPTLRYDCEEIWRQFEEAVVHQSSCNVTVEDYHQMFHVIPQTWVCDRFLFWSKTRTLMHSYAAVVPDFWTLEDTLVGYMFNDLIWCGQKKDLGFDFSSCPEWSACRNHPVYSLWRQASQNFAEMACGNVTVLLNGSIDNAFNRKSMFGSVELDCLNPKRVNYVNIKVVTNLEGPFIESCRQGSIVDLIQILQSRGFRWTCTDNDQTLTILQCVQNPKHSSCQTFANSLFHRKITFN